MNAHQRVRRRRLVSDINITPLTDVILVLLIIFMVTTPLILQSNIKVNLPSVTSARPSTVVSQVNITITDEKGVYLGNKAVTRKELKEKVAKAHKFNPSLEVVLYADKTVPFKDIVAVLGVINELRIQNLNIAVETETLGPAK